MLKHSDGYSNHIKVICPGCKLVLLECKGMTGQLECEMPEPKQIRYRKCNNCDPNYLKGATVITI